VQQFLCIKMTFCFGPACLVSTAYYHSLERIGVSVQCEHFGLRPPNEPLAIVDCFAAHNDTVKCGDHLSCRCLHTPGERMR